LAPKAIRAGFARFHAAEPISGKLDRIICVTVLCNHGLRAFVINGVTEVEETEDILSIVSENLDFMEEATPFVSIEPQLSFKYCN
jgi:hypothetical protein